MDDLFSYPWLPPRQPTEPNVPLPVKVVNLYAAMLDVQGFDSKNWFDTDSELVRCALLVSRWHSLISLGCLSDSRFRAMAETPSRARLVCALRSMNAMDTYRAYLECVPDGLPEIAEEWEKLAAMHRGQ